MRNNLFWQREVLFFSFVFAFSTILIASSNGGPYTADKNTVLLLHFNEGKGIPRDFSIHKQKIEIKGCNWVEGKFGKALRFNGKDDFVRIKSNDSLAIVGDITIEAWIKPLTVSGSQVIVSRRPSIGPDYITYVFRIGEGGRLEFLLSNPRTVRWRTNPCIIPGRWSHVAVVREAGKAPKFYLNGVLQVSGQCQGKSKKDAYIPPYPIDTTIGAGAEGSYHFFNGIIDEVRISNIPREFTKITHRSSPSKTSFVISEAPPSLKDIGFSSKGKLIIKNWMEIDENYGFGTTEENKLISRGKNWIEYENKHLKIKKSFSLKDNCLIVRQNIQPKTETGRKSDLYLHFKFFQKFSYYYIPGWGYSMPKLQGRFIKREKFVEIKEPSRGVCTNSQSFCLLIGDKVSLMLDRFMANGYVLPYCCSGCPSWVDGNLQSLIFPMFGHWARCYWNPGQIEPVADWRKNVYPKKGGTLEYHLYFIKAEDKEKARKIATEFYLSSRKEAIEKYYYPGWRKISIPPKEKIAFCAIVGGSWSCGKRIKMGPSHYYNLYYPYLKKMRKILDENGLDNYYIYFWIQDYNKDRVDDSKPTAGWGYFPTDVKDVKVYYKFLRENIHHIRLGLYVNFTYGDELAPVYKKHPEWYTPHQFFVEACTAKRHSYMGKLPGWGKYNIEGVKNIIKAYDLDFVFIDNGGVYHPAYFGTVKQIQEYIKGLSEAVHKLGAYLVGNGPCAYWDINYMETIAGTGRKGKDQDKEAVEFYPYIYGKKFVFGPELSRHGPPERLRKSGKAFFKWYADKPQFIPRFPIHFGGDILPKILIDEIFIPYVKKLAERERK
ncbi:LamG domain-containing protein [bacterium]|nr:LamG domain-containing protein [bacterium]